MSYGYDYDIDEGYLLPVGEFGGAESFVDAYNTVLGIDEPTMIVDLEDIDDRMDIGDWCSGDIVENATIDDIPIDVDSDGVFVSDLSHADVIEDLVAFLGGDPDDYSGSVRVECIQ